MLSVPAVLGSGERRVLSDGRDRLMPFRDVQRELGLERLEVEGSRWTARGRLGSLDLTPGSRRVSVNGTQVWLNGTFFSVRGRPALALVDVEEVLLPILRPDLFLADRRCETIVLDPGHGGRDPGAVGAGGLLEKDVTLDLGRRVRRILANEGFRVYLTRDRDRYVELRDRSRAAAARKADLFISLHVNSAPSPEPTGVETYRLTAPGYSSIEGAPEARFDPVSFDGNGFGAANAILGYCLQQSLSRSARGPDRGLKHARYVVLKNAPCPAVLVECGFLCNPTEEAMLKDSLYRERLAEGIAAGVRAYRLAVQRARATAPES
jgi:N-acetylmuramoyl-L-alanine amidase